MKRWLPFTGVLVSCVLIYWRVFLTADIFTWGDWGWYFSETVRQWLQMPQLWTNSPLGGVDISLTMYIPVRLAYGFLSQFMAFQYFDRIVFLVPSVLTSVISGYLLGKYITKSSLGGAVAATVLTLNSYALTLRSGHFTLSVAFGMAPLIVMGYIHTLKSEKKLLFSLLTGLAAYISFIYEPRVLIITGGIMGLYWIFHSYYSQKSFKRNFGDLLWLMMPFGVVALCGLYGILGLKFSSQTISTQILGRQLFGSGYVSIQRGLTLSAHAWTENLKVENPGEYVLPYFWIIPILAFVGLYKGRKNPEVVFFGLIALIGSFLIKHTNQPFPQVYYWLYKYVPGFSAFREPSKFYFLTGIGYAVLLAYLAAYISHSSIKRWLKIGTISSIFIIFLANGIPIIKGEFGKMLNARHIPSDYLILKEYLTSHPGMYRTMYVPVDSRWGYWDNDIRKINTAHFAIYEWPLFSDYKKEGLEYSPIDHVMSILEKKNSHNVLDLASVRYVIIPLEDKENEDIFIFAWGDRGEYVQRVSQLPYLKLLNINTSDLIVYENPSYFPLIYWTSDMPTIENPGQVMGNTKINRKSQTEIDVTVESIPATQQKIVIHFSERFDSRWKVRAGKFNWVESLLRKNYYVTGMSHNATEVNTQTFTLNIGELEKNFPGLVHTDSTGSKSIQLTLYFSPQAWVNGASILSAFSLVGISGLVIYMHKRNVRH